MATKKISTLLMLLVMLLCNNLAAQNGNEYVDSIDQYQKEVDSLVHAFYKIPPSNIGRGIIHYYCIGKSGGSYAELYRNVKGEPIQLTWQSNCDSLFEDKVFYFVNNEIVLAMDDGLSQVKKEKKYYKNGILVLENGVWIDKPMTDDKYLAKGYSVLKDFKR
jgi:hypothetical protein